MYALNYMQKRQDRVADENNCQAQNIFRPPP